MTLPDSLLRAIGRTVEQAGGDLADAHDLADAWERLDADLDRRAARMRHEVRQARCCCATSAEPDAEGRCSRCYGHLGIER